MIWDEGPAQPGFVPSTTQSRSEHSTDWANEDGLLRGWYETNAQWLNCGVWGNGHSRMSYPTRSKNVLFSWPTANFWNPTVYQKKIYCCWWYIFVTAIYQKWCHLPFFLATVIRIPSFYVKLSSVKLLFSKVILKYSNLQKGGRRYAFSYLFNLLATWYLSKVDQNLV